jgi:hypothetical protein
VTEQWRKLHEELHDFYTSPDIFKMMKANGATGQKRTYKTVVKKPEGRHGYRLKDNITLNVTKIRAYIRL